MINPVFDIGQTIADKKLRIVFFTSHALVILGAILLIMHVPMSKPVIMLGLVVGIISFWVAFVKLPKEFNAYLHLVLITSLNLGIALRIFHWPYAKPFLIIAGLSMVVGLVKSLFQE